MKEIDEYLKFAEYIDVFCIYKEQVTEKYFIREIIGGVDFGWVETKIQWMKDYYMQSLFN